VKTPLLNAFPEETLYMPLKDKCFSPDHAIIIRVESFAVLQSIAPFTKERNCNVSTEKRRN
jgi:hypothetical protein